MTFTDTIIAGNCGENMDKTVKWHEEDVPVSEEGKKIEVLGGL